MKINVTDGMKQKLQQRLAGTGDPELQEFLTRLQPPERAPQLTAAELTAVLGATQRRLTDVCKIVDQDRGRPMGELLVMRDELARAEPKLQAMLARQLEREEGGDPS